MIERTVKDSFKDTTTVWTGTGHVYTRTREAGKDEAALMSFTVKQAKRLRKALKEAILAIQPDAYED